MKATRDFKDAAKTAARYLADHGIEVPHTRILEALSRAFGERNWATLHAQLEAVPREIPTTEWAPSQGPMTQEQYVAHGGNRCPFCGGSALVSEDLEADGPLAWDSTTCESCGNSWNSDYTLSGFRAVNEELATPPQESREAVIDDLVDDVKRRARTYDFSYSSFSTARRLVSDSADALGLFDVSEEEVTEAANRLVG